MTTVTDMAQVRYSIDALLKSGVQPFDNLDDDAMDALAKGMSDAEALAVPIVLTSDGVLVDGHQRLLAMRRNGRKFVDVGDVRIIKKANAGNALEWAIRLNVQRRQLSIQEKAKIVRKLVSEHGWTQRTIAELFGVSQAAVSQWLNTDPDAPPKTKTGRPRKPPTPTAAVLAETNKYAAELTNPALHSWIVEHAGEDHDVVLKRWSDIKHAVELIIEGLTQADKPEGEPW